MVENKNSDLKFLGVGYQEKLVNLLMTDKEFANEIIEIIDPNVFTDENLRVIVGLISNSYKKYEIIPDYEGLSLRVNLEIKNDISKNMIEETINKLKKLDSRDFKFIKECAENFFSQQNLIKAMGKVEEIIRSGDISRYPECADIISKAVIRKKDTKNVFSFLDDLAESLSPDCDKIIPSTIAGLDDVFKVGKQDFVAVICPTGVGKTTFATRVANGGARLGYKTAQIVFEDKRVSMKRKHIASLTGFNSAELSQHRDEIIENLPEYEEYAKNVKIIKLKTGLTTVSEIKRILINLKNEGFAPDQVMIDYFECLRHEKVFKDINNTEGTTMRQLENLCEELDILLYIFIQGNRTSINKDVVTEDQMGGAIQKAQIAHEILSIAKTNQNKLDSTATLSVLKNRNGGSGFLFKDILFDNGAVQIDATISEDKPQNIIEYRKMEEKEAEDFVNSIIKSTFNETN